MKNLLTLLVLIFAINGFAQTDNLKQTEQYFEFNAVQRGPYSENEGYHILVIIGKKNLSKDSIIRNSIVATIQSLYYIEDVLEYMNSMGWKLVTAYATVHKYKTRFYYIMKKEIQQN